MQAKNHVLIVRTMIYETIGFTRFLKPERILQALYIQSTSLVRYGRHVYSSVFKKET